MPYISLGKAFLEYIILCISSGLRVWSSKKMSPIHKICNSQVPRRCRRLCRWLDSCRAVRPGGRSGSAALAVAGAGGGVQLDCCVASQSSCRAAALAVAESGGGGVLQDLSVASLLCRSGSQHSGVCQSDAAGYPRRARYVIRCCSRRCYSTYLSQLYFK